MSNKRKNLNMRLQPPPSLKHPRLRTSSTAALLASVPCISSDPALQHLWVHIYIPAARTLIPPQPIHFTPEMLPAFAGWRNAWLLPKKVVPPAGHAAPALLVDVRWENGTSHPAHITAAGDLVLALLVETPDMARAAMSPPPRRRAAVSVSRRLTMAEIDTGVRGLVHGVRGSRYPGNACKVSHIVALGGKGGGALCMRFEDVGKKETRMVKVDVEAFQEYGAELIKEVQERAALRWTSEAAGETRPFLEAFFAKAMTSDRLIRERIAEAMGGGGDAGGGDEEIRVLRKVAEALEKATT